MQITSMQVLLHDGWVAACPSTSPCTSSCALGNVCRYQTADVPFRVARLLLVEHNVAMHKVECSAGDVAYYTYCLPKKEMMVKFTLS